MSRGIKIMAKDLKAPVVRCRQTARLRTETASVRSFLTCASPLQSSRMQMCFAAGRSLVTEEAPRITNIIVAKRTVQVL